MVPFLTTLEIEPTLIAQSLAFSPFPSRLLAAISINLLNPHLWFGAIVSALTLASKRFPSRLTLLLRTHNTGSLRRLAGKPNRHFATRSIVACTLLARLHQTPVFASRPRGSS